MQETSTYKKRLSTQGYYFVLNKSHHRCNKQGYTKVADIVLEEKIGRKLLPNEIAHHINSVRTDDSPGNLEVMTKADHDAHTTKERWRKYKESGQWSMKFYKCVNCATRDKKHARRGLCSTCSHYLERGQMSESDLLIKQKKYAKTFKNSIR